MASRHGAQVVNRVSSDGLHSVTQKVKSKVATTTTTTTRSALPSHLLPTSQSTSPFTIQNSTHLVALNLALPAIAKKMTGHLKMNSALRDLFTSTIPQLFLSMVKSSLARYSHHLNRLESQRQRYQNFIKVESIVRRVVPLEMRRKLQKIHKTLPKATPSRHYNSTSHPNSLIPSAAAAGNNNTSTRPLSRNSPRLLKAQDSITTQPKRDTNPKPLLTQSLRQFSATGGKKASRTTARHHGLRSQNALNSLSYLRRFLPAPFNPQSAPVASLLTTSKRNFQFKRYRELTRWTVWKYHADIFSPVRTLYNRFRFVKYKLRRFLPGRFAGYYAFVLTGCVYTWIIMLMLERNRQFDDGWTNPEGSNFGYFLKRDWAFSNAQYDVEIFRKRKRYQKMDGNRFLHEEDLKVEQIRPARWKWMYGKHIDRYGKARGVWPLRSYVINSPQYVDRRYLSRGYDHRRDKFGKWVKAFGDTRNAARQKKRALRLRGGKYEYGGTAHQYYFTKTHDPDRFFEVPTTNIPKHARRLHDAGKY